MTQDDGFSCPNKPFALRLSTVSLTASSIGLKFNPKSINFFAASLQATRPGCVSPLNLHKTTIFFWKNKRWKRTVQVQLNVKDIESLKLSILIILWRQANVISIRWIISSVLLILNLDNIAIFHMKSSNTVFKSNNSNTNDFVQELHRISQLGKIPTPSSSLPSLSLLRCSKCWMPCIFPL